MAGLINKKLRTLFDEMKREAKARGIVCVHGAITTGEWGQTDLAPEGPGPRDGPCGGMLGKPCFAKFPWYPKDAEHPPEEDALRNALAVIRRHPMRSERSG